jgi:exodeoxyribonuclease V alpha subunit
MWLSTVGDGGVSGVHGGVKFYTGRAVDARRYVESDAFGADDYYLGEGSGVADRYVVTSSAVERVVAMDAETYERWVAGYDVDTGKAKGRLRTDSKGVKFVEVTVNGPKSWSLAAAAHPDVSQAYNATQRRAAEQILAWVGEHATTRVGPRGRQVQVPVERLEAAVVAHRTSRAGDPHWHLHLQVSSRVWAAGTWRGLHTVGFRESIAAINGIGHAAVMTDPGFRAALAAHGYHVDPGSGEIVELDAYGEAFSARSKQIGHNLDRYETQWRGEHPGEEPGPRLRQAWDRRAWAEERPDKVVPTSGAALEKHWRDELAELGFRAPRSRVDLLAPLPGTLDRDELADEALIRLGARRSAWSRADARGEAEQLIAESGRVVNPGVRGELAEDLTARIVAASVPLVGREDVPVDVRALTSPRVVAVERHLARRFADRAASSGRPVGLQRARRWLGGLGRDQTAAVAHLAGSHQLGCGRRCSGSWQDGRTRGGAADSGTAAAADAGGLTDVEGGKGRCRTGRHIRVLGGLAATAVRIPVGRPRALALCRDHSTAGSAAAARRSVGGRRGRHAGSGQRRCARANSRRHWRAAGAGR